MEHRCVNGSADDNPPSIRFVHRRTSTSTIVGMWTRTAMKHGSITRVSWSTPGPVLSPRDNSFIIAFSLHNYSLQLASGKYKGTAPNPPTIISSEWNSEYLAQSSWFIDETYIIHIYASIDHANKRHSQFHYSYYLLRTEISDPINDKYFNFSIGNPNFEMNRCIDVII